MAKYLIDVNLPYYFNLWNSDDYRHVIDIDDELSDTQIWEYAKEHKLTIVSKDTDFSDRILLFGPPPKVIQIKFGNMKIRDFHQKISGIWTEICELSDRYGLIRVFHDHLEGISV